MGRMHTPGLAFLALSVCLYFCRHFAMAKFLFAMRFTSNRCQKTPA